MIYCQAGEKTKQISKYLKLHIVAFVNIENIEKSKVVCERGIKLEKKMIIKHWNNPYQNKTGRNLVQVML